LTAESGEPVQKPKETLKKGFSLSLDLGRVQFFEALRGAYIVYSGIPKNSSSLIVKTERMEDILQDTL